MALLALPAVVLFGVIWKIELENIPGNQVSGDLIQKAEEKTSNTLGVTTSRVTSDNWEKKDFNDLGFGLQIPPEVEIKENNLSIEVLGKGISIYISKKNLSEIETINTAAEKDIDKKVNDFGAGFELIDSIAPVAIGSVTGITYTTLENGAEITYFYVPGNNSYLYIQNKSNPQDPEGLTASDNIIYSLEFRPNF